MRRPFVVQRKCTGTVDKATIIITRTLTGSQYTVEADMATTNVKMEQGVAKVL